MRSHRFPPSARGEGRGGEGRRDGEAGKGRQRREGKERKGRGAQRPRRLASPQPRQRRYPPPPRCRAGSGRAPARRPRAPPAAAAGSAPGRPPAAPPPACRARPRRGAERSAGPGGAPPPYPQIMELQIPASRRLPPAPHFCRDYTLNFPSSRTYTWQSEFIRGCKYT